MLKITKITRDCLESDRYWDCMTNRFYYRKCRHYQWVGRINFVRDGLHYSIQLSEGEGFDIERSIIVRCKEDKNFYKHFGYGTFEFLKLLFDWDWQKQGNTYKTFPVDKLEEAIFRNDNNEI